MTPKLTDKDRMSVSVADFMTAIQQLLRPRSKDEGWKTPVENEPTKEELEEGYKLLKDTSKTTRS